MAVLECKAGVKRLIREDSVRPNALVLVSDWSRQGTGYIVYQVLCDYVKPDQKMERVNGCRELWRIINCEPYLTPFFLSSRIVTPSPGWNDS